jgi:hypothetical protein
MHSGFEIASDGLEMSSEGTMEMYERRVKSGSVLIRSIVLFVLGLACIPLGLSFLPVFGILVGAGLIVLALYPWLNFLHSKNVNVMVGAVTDNNLGPMLMPVAILSASKERDGFDFDPSEVDPKSARFGPSGARPVEDMSNPEVYQRNLVDVNGDGIPDLLLYFEADTAGVTPCDKEACLSAKTRNGEKISGCNRVDHGYESGLNERLEYV